MRPYDSGIFFNQIEEGSLWGDDENHAPKLAAMVLYSMLDSMGRIRDAFVLIKRLAIILFPTTSFTCAFFSALLSAFHFC